MSSSPEKKRAASPAGMGRRPLDAVGLSTPDTRRRRVVGLRANDHHSDVLPVVEPERGLPSLIGFRNRNTTNSAPHAPPTNVETAIDDGRHSTLTKRSTGSASGQSKRDSSRSKAPRPADTGSNVARTPNHKKVATAVVLVKDVLVCVGPTRKVKVLWGPNTIQEIGFNNLEDTSKTGDCKKFVGRFPIFHISVGVGRLAERRSALVGSVGTWDNYTVKRVVNQAW